MAAWQLAIYLLPRSRLLELYGVIPGRLAFDTLDAVEWWRGKKLPPGVEPFLGSFSARGTHWHAGTEMWGDIESDHIEISRAEGVITGVYARLDAREQNDNFWSGLVELALKCDCVFWFPENERIVEPTVEHLLTGIRESSAFHFVTDPLGFLRGIEVPENPESES